MYATQNVHQDMTYCHCCRQDIIWALWQP